ncbi:MAG: TldD/PmbA family protein [Promethearchaeota archaeon]
MASNAGGKEESVLYLGELASLEDLASRVLDKATNRDGVRVAEVYVESRSDISLGVENGNLTKASVTSDEGFGIRTFNDAGGMGFAFCNVLDDARIEGVIDAAVRMMRVSRPDPDFRDLPEPAPYKPVDGVVDANGLSMSVEDYEGAIKLLVEASKVDDRLHSISCGLDGGAGSVVILNSNGVRARDQWTSFNASAANVVKGTNDQATGWQSALSRRFAGIDLEKVAGDATREAARCLGRRATTTGKRTVVFDPRAVKSIFLSGIVHGVDADDVQEKRSFLGESLGKQVAAPLLSVYSDPTIPGGPSSGPVDGEGVPGRKVPVLEGGVLENFLHNSYTAGKAGVESTGNASRGSYSAPPGISAANVVVSPGDASFEEMVAETRDGVLVLTTGDRPNTVTGEFSGFIMAGFLIEGGEVTHPLKNTNFACDLKEALKQVDMVGKESEWHGSTLTPAMRLEGWISSG